MANKAIIRVDKIKTMSSLAARGKHNFRERETPNADASRTQLNLVAGAGETDALMQGVSDLLPAKRRKDAVIALEYLITASPEYFGADWREQKNYGLDYFSDAIKWLQQRHGAENVLCATVHLDESTPHLAAFVVPKTKDGRLAAKDFVGGAAKLSKMQTEFAAQVGQKHGLERGVEWSKAVHKPNAAIAPMTAERLSLRQQVKDLEAEIERLTQHVASGDGALAKATRKADAMQKLNAENFHLINRIEKELEAAKAEVADLRGKLDQALQTTAAALRQAKQSDGKVAEMVGQLAKQGTELVAAMAAKAEAERQLAAAREATAQAQGEAQSMRTAKAEAERQLATTRNELAAAQEGRDEAARVAAKALEEVRVHASARQAAESALDGLRAAAKAPAAPVVQQMEQRPQEPPARPATVEEAQRAAIRVEEKRLGRPLARNSAEAAAIRQQVRAEWEAAQAPQPVAEPEKPVQQEVRQARSIELPPKATKGRGGR